MGHDRCGHSLCRGKPKQSSSYKVDLKFSGHLISLIYFEGLKVIEYYFKLDSI
jgi:hypothetical protein